MSNPYAREITEAQLLSIVNDVELAEECWDELPDVCSNFSPGSWWDDEHPHLR
jgi:hypothetical protein